MPSSGELVWVQGMGVKKIPCYETYYLNFCCNLILFSQIKYNCVVQESRPYAVVPAPRMGSSPSRHHQGPALHTQTKKVFVKNCQVRWQCVSNRMKNTTSWVHKLDNTSLFHNFCLKTCYKFKSYYRCSFLLVNPTSSGKRNVDKFRKFGF